MHVPGVSIAIIQQGEIVWAQGFGVSDVRSGQPVTTETVFEACSMSKPILALVAMQLVQEGRLDLDRPLVEYLGRDYLPDQPDHRRITARMALTHRTGFENWRAGYDEMGGPLALSSRRAPSTRTRARGSCSCNGRWRRSPAQPLERLAQERLFAPLGLARTSFVWTEMLETDLASGHREDGSYKERTRYRKANAAYSLYTTPIEYARLMLSLMRPELLGERAFTPESIELMLAAASCAWTTRTRFCGPASRGPSPPTARWVGASTSRRRRHRLSTPARTAPGSGRSASSIPPRVRESSCSPTATAAPACARPSSSGSATSSRRSYTARRYHS